MSDNQRSWICPKCNEELGELNAVCEYCKQRTGETVYNPRPYFIRETRIRMLSNLTGDSPMTPQEELFKDLFNHGVNLVKDMTRLQIREQREKMEETAFKARAYVAAFDAVEKELDRKEKKDKGPTGFQRNVNVDEAVNAEAVNIINKRKARMSQTERLQAGMIKLYMEAGMSEADATRHAAESMSAGKIINRLKDKAENATAKDIVLGNETRSPLSQDNGFTIAKPAVEISKLSNPSEADTKPIVQEPLEKPTFKNPFKK